MVIAGDQLHPTEASLPQALQKGTPVNFMLAQRHGNAQDLTFACRIDAHRHQNGQIADLSIFPDLLIIGIQEEERICA